MADEYLPQSILWLEQYPDHEAALNELPSVTIHRCQLQTLLAL